MVCDRAQRDFCSDDIRDFLRVRSFGGSPSCTFGRASGADKNCSPRFCAGLRRAGGSNSDGREIIGMKQRRFQLVAPKPAPASAGASRISRESRTAA